MVDICIADAQYQTTVVGRVLRWFLLKSGDLAVAGEVFDGYPDADSIVVDQWGLGLIASITHMAGKVLDKRVTGVLLTKHPEARAWIYATTLSMKTLRSFFVKYGEEAPETKTPGAICSRCRSVLDIEREISNYGPLSPKVEDIVRELMMDYAYTCRACRKKEIRV
jgi:hypothetical protein